MMFDSRIRRFVQARRVAFGFASVCLAVAVSAAAADAASPTVAVLLVEGEAYVKSSEKPIRIATKEVAVAGGDQLQTRERSTMAVMLGDHYVRLDESTKATLSFDDTGAPRIDVERGRVRVVDTMGLVPATITTPTLHAAMESGDLEAVVFAEKIGAVSMICPEDGNVTVAGPDGAARSAPRGGCVVVKPGEAPFDAPGDHERLAVLPTSLDDLPALPPVASYFAADPPPVSSPGGGIGFAPELLPDSLTTPPACTVTPCTPRAASPPTIVTPFPPVGPPI